MDDNRVEELITKLYGEMQKRFDKLESEIAGVKLIIENEIRPNMRLMAEGVDSLNNRMDAFMNSQAGAAKRIENLELTVMALQKKVREIEEKVAS